MGRPGIQTWTWALCAFWMCVSRALAGPQYMVTFPAVLEAGVQTKLCASLMQPSETLLMTVTLMSERENTTLFQRTSSADFHECSQFTTPAVLKEEVQNVEVKVQGDTFNSREVKKVLIKAYKPMTFVQTDKPIYLPGQTVHFRVVTLDTKFRNFDQLYNIIEIEDPHKNRIGQWLNEASDGKILQLSYSLNSEAREGSYQVIVSIGEDKIRHTFKVEKYVLPKFDITLNVSEEISVGDQEINATACANYTFRQPVPGYVTVQMCRPLNRYLSRPGLEDVELTPPCHKETKQADNSGCATFSFNMSTFTKIAGKALEDVLDVTAEVEEEGTGIFHFQKSRKKISYVIGRLSFFDTPKIFEPGSVVEGKVKAVYFNNTPIPDMPVYLFEGESWSSRRLQNLTTDSSGVANFSLSTENLNGDIRLHISSSPTLEYVPYKTPFYESGSHTLSIARPPSLDTKTVSYLKVKANDETLACDAEADITIQYVVVGERQDTVDVMYLVLSRGAIVSQGHKQVELKNKQVDEGEVSFKLLVSPEMAPEVQIVAFVVLPSENVIANSADFSTEKCFSHKVSLEFSPSSAVPGEDINMQLMANPNSLCGVSAIDQSVLIKEPGKTLNAEKIFSLLPVRKATFIPYQVKDATECLHVRPKRSIFPFPGQDTDDAHTVFENVGLKVATNLLIEIPSCLQYRGREYHHNRFGIVSRRRGSSAPILEAARGKVAAPSSPDAAPIETVRTFFPETWIWGLVEVGSSGKKNVSLTVPDTITTWETDTFCLSPHGFGLAPRKQIPVFQPFFLEFTLPYCIIRGEWFELKATVFNYLSSCIMLKVTPALSSDYTLTLLPGYEYTFCLCGNERNTFRWIMNPTTLGAVNVTVKAEAVTSPDYCNNETVSVPDRGRIDTVSKFLIVKAQGVEKTDTYNWLLCTNGQAITEEIELQLPEHVIEGSARALVSVLGDILGRALKNIDGLLRMPYGCGEQNMALLAPNIYILQYLENTKQLTPAIREKASNFLTSGYQRQLNYKHQDGAYSTFGAGTGNTWLTAFVVRSFAKAKSFIYIDPTTIEQSRKWLESKQQENGCFEQSGKLFNNRMKGGVSDEVTLSAYVTAAFLEMNVSAKNPVVKKSLSCLKESIGNLSNTYTTALMAYVFTLAGDMETRGLLLDHLDKVAIKEGGFLHWSQRSAETSASLSVEISSYVLMAKLSASPTNEDLGYASGIVRWLTRQQNYYGGFSSTQDTVVALQALALYATLVFSPQGSSTVKVQSPSEQLTFNVNQDNRLLYQERILQDVTGKFSLEVEGTACVSVQISLLYNIPPPAQSSNFSVEATTEVNSTGVRPKFILKLKVQYNGKESSTNMVILDIQVLSGFVPDSESLKKLKDAVLVDRVEQKNGGVQVYIRELAQSTPVSYTLELREDIPVQNLKPAVVKIYDYYQPSDHAETEYAYHQKA
ncbi:alpha-2-macroglobulin-like [Acanthochromis polyacanthus]|uniref:alpha-2-macroglobulin-like n=1 Tax=Acanthochromis polyacanthus TaxID=80966 RepID=UPI0022343E7F|nr:alpha-2-macroglobulin-like [Acanthochromis polyacanthus]